MRALPAILLFPLSLATLAATLSCGAGAAHIAVDPSGRFILTAHYDGNSITVHALRADGGIDRKLDEKRPGKNAHQAVLDSSGRFVFVPCLGSNLVAQYKLVDGKLV